VPTVQGDKASDFTASDILSAKLWQPRADRPPLGIDLACTKVAVDFQNITAGNADTVIRQSLEILREAINTDAVFLVLLDGHGERIDSIASAKGPFAQCRPEVLKGEPLDVLPWIRSRLEHVRILEIRDTVKVKPEQASDAERLAGLDIRSLLLIAFAVQGTVRGFLAFATSSPRDGWDVNLHLLLKLVGTSLACGLEKVSLADRLADMQERQEMALPCANDGLWDYDAQTNHTWFSPRWKGMLGFAEGDVITSPDWHRMVHPEDLARVSAAMRDHIAGKLPMFESVHRLKKEGLDYHSEAHQQKNNRKHPDQFIMGNPAGNPDPQAGGQHGERSDNQGHEGIDVPKRKRRQVRDPPAVYDIGQGSEKRGYDNQRAGIADRQMNGQSKQNHHERYGDYSTPDAEKSREGAAGQTDQQQRSASQATGFLRRKVRVKEKEFQGHHDLHQTKETLEPDSGEFRRKRRTCYRPDHPPHDEVSDLTPVHIPPLSMTQGTAESRWNDYGQTGTERGVNDEIRCESGKAEAPEKKRDQDDSAPDPQQTCQKTGQRAKENEHDEDVGSE
jgi:PAS domain-containing protein